MSYWLCISNSENWEAIKKENVWGVPDKNKNTINRVQKGDKVIIYGKQEKKDDEIIEPRIYGIFEVTSKPYKDSKKVFKMKQGESYPHRVDLKAINIPKNPLPFKPLIPKLDFIYNKKRWHTHLFGKAMREIPEKDFKTIEKNLS